MKYFETLHFGQFNNFEFKFSTSEVEFWHCHKRVLSDIPIKLFSRTLAYFLKLQNFNIYTNLAEFVEVTKYLLNRMHLSITHLSKRRCIEISKSNKVKELNYQ